MAQDSELNVADDFRLDWWAKGENAFVFVAGELDTFTSKQLKQVIEEVVATKPVLVDLDISEVRFMDSQGISAIVSFYKTLRDMDSKFRVLNPKPNVLAVLDLTGVTKMFEVVIRPEEES